MTTPITLTSENANTVLRGLPQLARAGFKSALALRTGSLRITTPEGNNFTIIGSQPGPDAELTIKSWAFARRVLNAGDVGVGESYMAGEWSSENVTTFLELFCVNRDATFNVLQGNPVFRAIMRLRHWLNRNTRTGSKRNISAHYDLGNAFYDKWLDRSMTYSSAIFDDDAIELEDAQKKKYARLAENADIQSGHSVLEIGCGWGGFAEFAARDIGADVTALTISKEQFDFARQRIFNAGLSEKVTVKLQDYRDETGVYDRIASIEMFEAVGEPYWKTYFNTLGTCLKAGGKAGLQIITIQDQMFDDYRENTDFIQQYVFPGGMLPAPGRLNELANRTGLELTSQLIFGQDYARTLKVWRERFINAWPQIKTNGFDDRFKRLWEFYLHYCEAGFRSGNIDVRQMTFIKPQ